MLRHSIVFLILAIIAAVFGFGGVAETAAPVAQALCMFFASAWIVSILLGRGGSDGRV
ncbi:DUF1328 domain-containing protein [Pelagicoccus sp. NFK12]|uniref:DUF1328 domain-containing protein n=1 Tax=Pelagicoccus enzymogenes TaxID=2773457 RepID=A0A927F8G2_9BACT|nr:DUF1328 domain-containing protein [Pelagicoccus enzymogenes]